MFSNLGKKVAAVMHLAKAARHYDSSLAFQILRSRRLHNRSLFSLEDILFWGLTDPAISGDLIDCYMSREARVRLQRFFNDPEAAALVDDKAVFYRICEGAGLKIPKTFGVLSGKGSKEPDGSDYQMINLADLPCGEYVAKPAWGCKGQGLIFFSCAADGFKLGGRTVPLNTAEEELLRAAGNDVLVVQQRVAPHEELAAVSGTRGVQSVRAVTYLDRQNNVNVLFIRFKFLTQGNLVDNFADGKTGNLIASVDPDSGLIESVSRKIDGVIGLERVVTHPDTGVSLMLQLPDWEALHRLVHKAARYFPALPLLAWDIGLSTEGPVLLEANQDWEIFPIAPYRVPPAEPRWKEALGGL